uniref:Uncharacterized protein n=1 Tax=Knipowitschia caucasica TaxID=637954 RepID=A0AAV2JSL7_KNICA
MVAVSPPRLTAGPLLRTCCRSSPRGRCCSRPGVTPCTLQLPYRARDFCLLPLSTRLPASTHGCDSVPHELHRVSEEDAPERYEYYRYGYYRYGYYRYEYYRYEDYRYEDYRYEDYRYEDYRYEYYRYEDYRYEDYRYEDYRYGYYRYRDYRDYRYEYYRYGYYRYRDYRDNRFYDVPSLTYSDPLSLVSLGHDDRDLSYWRRRGQDFSLLLDYADGRELRASTTAWRPQALLTAEELRAERQAQQLWEDLSWLRDPDSAPGQLRVTEEERKCQSLGNEEWRPSVSLGRSESEDRWALDPYRLRTPDGFFHTKSRAKSQTLPRVLSPEGNTCRELVPSRPSLPDRQRMSSTVFSGPYSSKQLREELPVPPRETGFREYRVVAHLSRRRSNDGRTVKLDLSDEPVETPLCDFSPTTLSASAEVPWADRQPMQDASTLTSPPDYEDICQTLRQTRDPSDASGTRSNDEMTQDSEEECPICKREMENQMRQGPLPPLHEENSSDSSTNQNASPPQRAELESPPEEVEAKEVSGTDVTGSGREVKREDLASGSNLSDPKDLQGQDGRSSEIGVNTDGESQTEEIKNSEITTNDVPKDGQNDGSNEEGPEQPGEGCSNVGDVSESRVGEEKVSEINLNHECKDEQAKVEEQDKKPLLSPEHRLSLWTQLGRDPAGLPEFPPDRLPLSVPPTLDRRLSLSLEGERKSRGLSHRIEALQNKLAISPGRVAVERISRMREVDVICRVRRLSIRSTDSGEGDNDTESKKEEVEDPPEPTEKDDEDTRQEQVGQSQTDPEETGAREAEPSPSGELTLLCLEIKTIPQL